MIEEQEAQELMKTLISMRDEYKNNPNDMLLHKLNKHKNLCVEKFSYIVTMRTARYRRFSNYQDLNQEGFEALTKAMRNYNPSKGSFFWWAHKYVDTRIARSANAHSTVKIPLLIAKFMPPVSESIHDGTEYAKMIDKKNYEDIVEEKQINEFVNNQINNLSSDYKEVLNKFYGLNGEKVNIEKLCKDKGISRNECLKMVNKAVRKIREAVK